MVKILVVAWDISEGTSFNFSNFICSTMRLNTRFISFVMYAMLMLHKDCN
jgi:hypothetical protein